MIYSNNQLKNPTLISPNNLSQPSIIQQIQPHFQSVEGFNGLQYTPDSQVKEESLQHSHLIGISDQNTSQDLKGSTTEISKSTMIEDEEEEFSNLEDYTSHSFSYPEYNESLEEDQANKLQIERCRGQASFQFSTDGNEGSTNQQYIFLTVPRILKQTFESQLYGDIILESNYSNSEEKSVNSFCNWKLLSHIEKCPSFLKIHAQDITKTSENFLAAIQICMQNNKKEVFDLANLFTQFSRIYNFIKTGFSKMAEYIEIFSKHDQLINRRKVFDQKSDQYLSKIPQHSIFFAVKIQPNFKTLQLETSSICFSNSLFKLANIDIDQFISVSLKGKSPEFFGWQARLMFLRHKLQSYLRFSIIEDGEIVEILTRDGMRVPTRSRREKVTFDLDKEIPGLDFGQLSEFLIIYNFDVDPSMQSQINFMRENYSIEGFENQDHSDFHTYSLETQAFLDLYYSQYTPTSKTLRKKFPPKINH